MPILHLVVAQMNPLVGDFANNSQRIIELTQSAIDRFQADCVIFPEMILSGYPPEDLILRSDFLEQCQQALGAIQEAKLPTTMIIGYPCQINNHRYNQAAVIEDGSIKATYQKQKLPNYTVFDEKRYFESGNSPCIFTLKGVRIGLLICEDLWFPEPIQQAQEAGAQLIIVPNASPFDHHKANTRQSILKKRTQETQLPIVYANLVGGQDELVFDGGSMMVNQNGDCCDQAPYFEEHLLSIPIEVSKGKINIQKNELPPPLSIEENIYQTLLLGVRDYVQKNHFPGALLGLSGGIDSALTVVIAVDALGAEQVETVFMPSPFTSEISYQCAQEQAHLLGVHYTMIDIDPIFKAFLNGLKESFTGLATDTTEENIQARIRGALLMALSNKKGSIVLTTGNKSELSVGYATLYGDMAGGFSVLKDVPKTMVYRLANYRNRLSTVIPQAVIDRAPSAELAPDQFDQDSLPPYPILDDILVRYIELDQSMEIICQAGLDPKTVEKVIKMIHRNEYKRRQAPIGVRITQCAFGKDRRYPITSSFGK